MIKTLPSDLNGASTDGEIAAEFMKLVNANTKFVTFSHLSNVSGRLLPAEKICKDVHAEYPNCHVHVDGAMTWGCMNLNLLEMDCDRLVPAQRTLIYQKVETSCDQALIITPNSLYLHKSQMSAVELPFALKVPYVFTCTKLGAIVEMTITI